MSIIETSYPDDYQTCRDRDEQQLRDGCAMECALADHVRAGELTYFAQASVTLFGDALAAL
jgi:hypothetical protein